MKPFIKASLMLALVLACSTRVFAQDETLEKPTKPQKQTTTTTTKPNKPQKQTTTTKPNSSSKVSEPTGYINGHGYVDLGLSVKWATCNVGASSPSDYGNYYAWGETSTMSEYSGEYSKTYLKSGIGDIAGFTQYDAARANWGSTWGLPTKSEIEELVEKCTWTWTSQGGHNGYKVTGPNGNSIFLPTAGWRIGTSLYGVGEWGSYWSGTPYGDDAVAVACNLYIDNDEFLRDRGYRYYGRSVRPVSD